MENEVMRRYIAGMLIPWVTLFNISYITIIALLTLLKSKSKLRYIQEKGESSK
ncbi:hypothetical protein [Clostridium sp.]|uniref:hypothetical protein n=1 Tax=Clostridium sp. TaxID=1506 RepID=UPI003D6CC974